MSDFINYDKVNKSNSFKLVAIAGILTLLFLIGKVVYLTGGTTSFVHLMYIPILITVFLFGIKAGIIASLIAGLILGPQMPLIVSEGIMQETRSWVFRIIMFITIVIFVGLLLKYIKSITQTEKRRAYTDIITGYPNCNKLVEDLNQMITEQRYTTMTLVVFEYKNREMINQYVNYEVGTKSFIKLLKMADNFFNSCSIYTISTNKFIIIIPNYDHDYVYKIANEFANKTKQPMFIDTLPISIIIKGGIVNFPVHGNNSNDIMLKLEKVLTQVSKSQKNITIYDNKLETESIKYYNTLVSLYYSLQNDMFELVYQPKINIKNNKLISTEALLRIKGDTYNNISISQLITMAEDVGFINEITKWVIDNSIIQLKEWQDAGINNKVSINLSSIDLNDDTIVNYTIQCLEKYGVDPSMIEFELTERSIIEDEKRTLNVLNKIKEYGIKISLDDYGTGYNSLRYLVNVSFPFDYLKIDKMFIDDILEEQNEVIVEGIISAAHVLGIEVIAEGVETKEQVDILKKVGCDIIQGYYYSKPLYPEEFYNYKKIHAKLA